MTDTDTQKKRKAKPLGITALWGPSNTGKTTIVKTLLGEDYDGPPLYMIDHDNGEMTLDAEIRKGQILHHLLVVDAAPSTLAVQQAGMRCINHIQKAAALAAQGQISGIVLDGLSTLYDAFFTAACMQNQQLAFNMSTDGKTSADVMGLYKGPSRAIGIIINVLASVAKRTQIPVLVILHSKETFDDKMQTVLVPDVGKGCQKKLRRNCDLFLRCYRYPGRTPEMTGRCPQNKYTRVRGGAKFEEALNNYLAGGGYSLREIAQLWDHVADTAVDQ